MKIWTWTLLLTGLVFWASAVPAVEPPTIVKMQNKQGEVTFHHQEHQAAVNDCTDCHHMGVEAGGCRGCHGVKREVPRIKQAFHRQCRNCHIKNGGPIECDTCHDVKKNAAAK